MTSPALSLVRPAGKTLPAHPAQSPTPPSLTPLCCIHRPQTPRCSLHHGHGGVRKALPGAPGGRDQRGAGPGSQVSEEVRRERASERASEPAALVCGLLQALVDARALRLAITTRRCVAQPINLPLLPTFSPALPLLRPMPPTACSIQRPDGSWYGNWGVCFTYATWFGAEALAAVGEGVANSPQVRPSFTVLDCATSPARALGCCPACPHPKPPHPTSPQAKQACAFLLSKQRADGGWGESYLSCQDKVRGAGWLLRVAGTCGGCDAVSRHPIPPALPHPLHHQPPQVYSQLPRDTSHAVNTAWALLALIAAGYHEIDRRPLDAAARCLIQLQVRGGEHRGLR